MKKQHQTSIKPDDKVSLPKITNALSAKLYLQSNEEIIIPYINHSLNAIGGLDLSDLHPNVKEYLLRWLIEVNRPRLSQGLYMLITYEIIKQCPIWKSIRMPYKLYKLEKVNMLKKLHDKDDEKNDEKSKDK